MVCPPDHPLARKKLATPRDMRGVKFLHLKGTDSMVVRTPKGLRDARRVFQDAGVVDTGYEVGSLSTLAGLIAAGLGVGLAPETSLPQFSLLPTVAVRISEQMMTRPIYFVSQKGRTLSPAAQGMRTLLFENPHLGQPAAQV